MANGREYPKCPATGYSAWYSPARTLGVVTLFVLGLCMSVGVQRAHASTPSITAFTATPSSINSGYPIQFTWTGSGASGYDIYFACPEGVRIQTVAGASVTCNALLSAGDAFATSATFSAVNASSVTKSVTVNMFPRDASGVDYTAGVVTTTFSIAPIAQPILSFTSSASVVPSASQVSFNWVANPAVTGVNLSIDCVDGLEVSIGSPAVSSRPSCGSVIYSAAQPASGTFTLTATNTRSTATPLTVRVWPQISASVFDGTRAMSSTVSISAPVAAAPTTPSISAFTNTPTSTPWNGTTTLSWAAQNTNGVNFQFICPDGVTLSALSATGASSTPIKCGTLAFSSPLPASGNTSFVVMNTLPFPQTISVSVWPLDAQSNYNGIYSKSLSLSILPAESSVPTSVSIPSSATSSSSVQKNITSTIDVPTSGIENIQTHAPFTKNLKRGSRGLLVRMLQQYLAQNPEIYPEGAVTEYYGPATQGAVQRFQEKYGIAHRGEEGYGSVGPRTRAVLNLTRTP